MATITTRAGKGSPLTNDEVDANFTNLNTDKAELSGANFTGAVDVDGNITTTGTVDGRDIASDGTKLDGVESGATADQTAAEIRTLVDSAIDSNVFTDADHTKLDGIEANATADQTASEIRTLVDSATDSNVFTDADHTKLDGIEASATADQTDAEIRAAVEAATDSNVFTDADHTKLDGIEASADVTDTTNVTAAGALMDSEVTNLAQVKAFDSTDYATAAQGSTADSALQNVVEDTTPQLGGNLASNGNDILFADNDKAIFGASDLKIYHDGSDSYIDDTGTGRLRLRGAADIILAHPTNGETYATFSANGANTFYYDNTARLATSSTGIDVTGTAVTDGVTVAGNLSVDGGTIKLDGNYPTGSNNVALGDAALDDASLSGGNNTAIGSSALTANTTGANNTAVGHNAGVAVTTGTENTLIGSLAGDALTDADGNVALGYVALSNDQQGSNSTAIGRGALSDQRFTSATGAYNTAVGYHAGVEVTTGVQNVLIGGLAGDALTDADFNVVVGLAALSADTLGSRSTALGHGALENQNFTSATDTYNVAVGYVAGISVTTGVKNTLIGGLAGDKITTGSKNTILGGYNGNQNGLDIRTSSNNIVLSDGDGNPRGIFDSSGNLLVGRTSVGTTGTGHSIRGGDSAVFARAGGEVVIFSRSDSDGEILRFDGNGSAGVGSIGVNAGSFGIGQSNTGLGFFNTDRIVFPATSAGAVQDNAINLGYAGGRFKDLYLSGQVTSNGGNNTIRASFQISGTQYGYINVTTSGTLYSTSSDYRLKENVVPLTNATARLKQLNPLRFSFIPDETKKIVDGFLAHEVQDVVPEAIAGSKDAMKDEEYEVTPAVYEDVVIPAVLDEEGNEVEAERTEQQLVSEAVMGTRSVPDYQGIDQSKLVPLLVATIQELEARIAALESN